jgi:hypothetical protein
VTLPLVNARMPVVNEVGTLTRYGEELLRRVRGNSVSNTADLRAEESARSAADAALQAEVDAEEVARAGADTTLQGNIDAEATTRADADTTLQGNIDALAAKFLTATATLDFPSIAAQSSAELTMTVAGAAVGDAVALGLPSPPASGLTFNGYVSAADTVAVRAVNATAAAVDPASATYRATVIRP